MNIAHPTAAQATGEDAEDRAAAHLASHGIAILERNYRTRLGEIDLIAQDGPSLVFVEVRARAGAGFGGALESITQRKCRRIIAAARQYLMRYRRPPPCRFDVVCVESGHIEWLRGAFEAT